MTSVVHCGKLVTVQGTLVLKCVWFYRGQYVGTSTNDSCNANGVAWD